MRFELKTFTGEVIATFKTRRGAERAWARMGGRFAGWFVAEVNS